MCLHIYLLFLAVAPGSHEIFLQHLLELVKVNSVILRLVVLLENISNLVVGDLTTVLAERHLHVLPANVPSVVNIKRVIDAKEHLLVLTNNILDVERGRNELSVVDLVVLSVVELLDEAFQICLRLWVAGFLHRGSQL